MLLAVGVWPAHAQTASRPSYQHLSDRARMLFDPLANGNGLPDDARAYNRLEESKRTTFEAIVHALEHLGIDDVIARVDRPWGSAAGDDGRDQYRLSVTLVEDGHTRLEQRSDFRRYRYGHVKRANGEVVGRARDLIGLVGAWAQVDCVRQEWNGKASVQISWLQSDPTVGDVDIDYRDMNSPEHHLPRNSDVRARRFDGTEHYDLHIETYGANLVNWWNP